MLTLTVLYGSQTGTAQEVGERIAREIARRANAELEIDLRPMNEISLNELQERKVAVFVCSTTGQGDEPDNMKTFWRTLLQRSLSSDTLRNLQFGVFGLGDSSYPRFNFPAKKLHARLMQLGAAPLLERGDGDDMHPLGYDGALEPWLTTLWDKLTALGWCREVEESKPDPAYNLEFVDNAATAASYVTKDTESPEHIFSATVLFNNRITHKDHFQDTRHVRLQLPSRVTYQPGDIIYLRPENNPEDVQTIIERMGWSDIADKPFRITPKSTSLGARLPSSWPEVMTIRSALTKHLDLCGRVKRCLFEVVRWFTQDEMQREKLFEFCTTAGQPMLNLYAFKPRRTPIEVLQDFHSVMFPPAYIFDILPPLRPRAFSIASAPSDPKSNNSIELSVTGDQSTNTLDLCVAVVKYRTELRAERWGVCSRWISSWQPNQIIERCWITKGILNMPKLDTPLLCIAAGTGIAPVRAIITARLQQQKQMTTSSPSTTSNTMLIFGCRSPTLDHYFNEEMNTWAATGVDIITAFSRLDPSRKIYVQTRILEHASQAWNMITQGGIVYVCGNANTLPDAVRRALVTVIEREGGVDEEQAIKVLDALEKSGRVVFDCWA